MGPQFVVSWEIDGETYTQREDFFPYLLPKARGCQCLHPLTSSSERGKPFDRRCVFGLTPILCTLNLTMLFLSHGFLPVTHLLYPIVLTCCHIPVYLSQRDSLSKHTGSLGTNKIYDICLGNITIVSWSKNCLQMTIIISYLKPYYKLTHFGIE